MRRMYNGIDIDVNKTLRTVGLKEDGCIREKRRGEKNRKKV